MDLTGAVLRVEWANNKASGWVARRDKCFVCLEDCQYRCCDCRHACPECAQAWGQTRDRCGACDKPWVLRVETSDVELEGTLTAVWDELQDTYGLVMMRNNVFEQYF